MLPLDSLRPDRVVSDSSLRQITTQEMRTLQPNKYMRYSLHFLILKPAP